MTATQIMFFESLGKIQGETAGFMSCELNKYEEIEDLLTDAIFETIVAIMELIDGYYEKNVKLDIINKYNNETITNGIELHDVCVEFLKYKGI